MAALESTQPPEGYDEFYLKYPWVASLRKQELGRQKETKKLHEVRFYNTAGIEYVPPPPAPPWSGVGYPYRIDTQPRLGHAWNILRLHLTLPPRGMYPAPRLPIPLQLDLAIVVKLGFCGGCMPRSKTWCGIVSAFGPSSLCASS